MTRTAFDRSQAYRMVDALRDYADLLDAEQDGEVSSLGSLARFAAGRIENGERIGLGLVLIDNFDRDAAHSAIIGVMTARRERAEALRTEAEALEGEAMRYEKLLDIF